MKKWILAFLLAGAIWSCDSPDQKPPEPHLELGQRLSFVGAEPEKVYVVLGYRNLPEDKTDKNWANHDYIVVSYTNDQGDMKVGVIHRNAVLKR